jgi:SAM-dependent methyltransferase
MIFTSKRFLILFMRLKILGSVVVLALAGIAFWSHRDALSIDTIAQSARQIGWLSFFTALAWVLIQNGCQASRLWFLLLSRRVSWARAAYAFSVGQWLNSFVPARAGDVVKALAVSDADAWCPVSESMGVVVADKIVDLSSLFGLVLFTGAVSHIASAKIDTSKFLYIALGATLLLICAWIFLRATFTRRFRVLDDFGRGLRCMTSPARLIPGFAMSIGSWAAEAYAIQSIVSGLGVVFSFSQAMFCLFALNAAIAIPISVANVGTFEAALVYAFTRFGVGLPQAITLATLHHLLQWIGISLWAFFSWTIKTIGSRKPSGLSAPHKKRAIAHFEKLSGDYDDIVSRGPLGWARGRERAIMLEFADLSHPELSMIDVGCGAGFYALNAKRAGMRVWAVDSSPGMLEGLRDRVDEIRVADIETLSLPATFDRVVCAGVLDFVSNPERAFENLLRLVSRAGRLIVLAPRSGPGGLLYVGEKLLFGLRVNMFTVAWFRNEAAKHGFILARCAFPLPFNMALVFERKGVVPEARR